MQPSHVDVFTTDDPNIDLNRLDRAKPIASATDAKGEGKAAVDFDPQGARYVVLRWTLNRHSKRAFSVAEIHAFGNVPLALIDVDDSPERFVANVSTGLSNNPGGNVDPPVIAPVSP